MSQFKSITTCDGIKFLISKDNEIFKRGIFSNLSEDSKIHIHSKNLKYIIENKFINTNVNQLIQHLKIIRPFSLLYHERKCYLKLFKLDQNYKRKNIYEMFNCLKTRDWYKLPILLGKDFLEYQREYCEHTKLKLISDLIFFAYGSGYVYCTSDSRKYIRTDINILNNYYSNKYIVEYLTHELAQKSTFRGISGANFFNYILEKKEYLNKRRIIKKFCSINGQYLRFANDTFKDDEKIVRIALENDVASFQYASARLRDCEEIAIWVCSKNIECYKFISDRLKNSEKVFLSVLQGREDARITYIYDCFMPTYNRMENKFPVSKVSTLLSYSSEKIRNDSILVNKIINIDPFALTFASERIRSDRKVVMKACEKNGNIISHLPKKYRRDFRVMTLSCLYNKDNIIYANKKIKNIILRKINSNKKLDNIMYRRLNKRKYAKQNMERIRKYKV